MLHQEWSCRISHSANCDIDDKSQELGLGTFDGAATVAFLNSHGLLQSGHFCSCAWLCCSHFVMHCRCRACPHTPQTTGLSSPGNRPSGGQPSKEFLQMPHTSSPASHVQFATMCHFLTVTLNVIEAQNLCRESCSPKQNRLEDFLALLKFSIHAWIYIS